MTREHDFASLQRYGGASCLQSLQMYSSFSCISFWIPWFTWGSAYSFYQVKGLATKLKTNLEAGINGDEPDLLRRRNTFGSNTYPRKKGRSFFVWPWLVSFLLIIISVMFGAPDILSHLLQRFLWEAWQDLTLIILIIAAVVSLGLGIKTEVVYH